MDKYINIDTKISWIASNNYKYFFNKANVVGLGLGYKIKKGFYTKEKCITVFVRKKYYFDYLLIKDLIPKRYMGIKTDVVQCGNPITSSLRTKIRPAIGGYSIGVNATGSGTMGCLVGDSDDDYILTCNHVIAANSIHNEGKNVIQPAREYGGRDPRDSIGSVCVFDEVDINRENFTDSAIAKTNRDISDIDVALIGPILGTHTPTIGENVRKVGASTELTHGVIREKNVTISVNFLGRDVIFKNQITTSKMSEAGDSGAILVNKRREALGLLMADTETISIYNNIQIVLNRLNVHILRH